MVYSKLVTRIIANYARRSTAPNCWFDAIALSSSTPSSHPSDCPHLRFGSCDWL